jgi:hypothetical protein
MLDSISNTTKLDSRKVVNLWRKRISNGFGRCHIFELLIHLNIIVMISLKNVLLANGVSSGATGLLLIVFGNTVASLFGVGGPAAFWGVGLFLIVFSALVINEGLKKNSAPSRVRLIIALDVSWVIGSVAIVVLQLFNLSTIGYVAIAAVAAWVGMMALLQSKGLKRIVA